MTCSTRKADGLQVYAFFYCAERRQRRISGRGWTQFSFIFVAQDITSKLFCCCCCCCLFSIPALPAAEEKKSLEVVTIKGHCSPTRLAAPEADEGKVSECCRLSGLFPEDNVFASSATRHGERMQQCSSTLFTVLAHDP